MASGRPPVRGRPPPRSTGPTVHGERRRGQQRRQSHGGRGGRADDSRASHPKSSQSSKSSRSNASRPRAARKGPMAPIGGADGRGAPGGPAPRRVRWWLLQAAGAAPRAKVPTEDERTHCDRLLAGSPALAAALGLTVAFVRLIQERAAAGSGPWLTAAAQRAEVELREFAAGLARDRAAVEAALRLPWSTGPV